MTVFFLSAKCTESISHFSVTLRRIPSSLRLPLLAMALNSTVEHIFSESTEPDITVLKKKQKLPNVKSTKELSHEEVIKASICDQKDCANYMTLS